MKLLEGRNEREGVERRSWLPVGCFRALRLAVRVNLIAQPAALVSSELDVGTAVEVGARFDALASLGREAEIKVHMLLGGVEPVSPGVPAIKDRVGGGV